MTVYYKYDLHTATTVPNFPFLEMAGKEPNPPAAAHHPLPKDLQSIIDKADKEDNFYDELYDGE